MQGQIYQVGDTHQPIIYQSDLADDENTESTSIQRCCRRWRHLQTSLEVHEWVSSKSYNAFRYSMVLLYIGTMLVVLGYHNVWLNFVRYVGLVLVVVGLTSVSYAMFDCFNRLYHRRSMIVNPEMMNSNYLQTLSSRVDSEESKMGLPSYDIVAGFELPTYEEAEALRLHPDKIPDDYIRRQSLIPPYHGSVSARNSLSAFFSTDLATSLRRHSFPIENSGGQTSAPSPPPQYARYNFPELRANLFASDEACRQHQLPVLLVETFDIDGPSETPDDSIQIPEPDNYETNPVIALNRVTTQFTFHSTFQPNLSYPPMWNRRRRASMVAPLPQPLVHLENEEEHLRQLRRTISARPQTSRPFPPIIDSDDEDDETPEEIVESENDSESGESEWESKPSPK